jgi:hypothetical protein
VFGLGMAGFRVWTGTAANVVAEAVSGIPPFIGTSRSNCTNTSRAKKLRYMSKIAAIFATADNTHVSCTQPIANLRMAYS